MPDEKIPQDKNRGKGKGSKTVKVAAVPPEERKSSPEKAARAVTHPVGDQPLPQDARDTNRALHPCWLQESTLRNKQNKPKE